MRDLRDYATITGTYWVFTLTDGALRMLVLLHLHELGHPPLEIASLFLLYELFGVVTNLAGGWIGARHGLKATLVVGLALQIAACGLLAARASALGLVALLVAQALAGVAKDLTKMSAKSYVKRVVAPEDARGLLRWVAVLTGSKNALKGVGFFLGGALLAAVGFRGACLGMAAALSLALAAAAVRLPRAAGRASGSGPSRLLSDDARVNWLSASRLFLFGARDVWFVIALPVFLSGSLGWAHARVGGFLALWVIGYGIVQASAPAWLRGRGGGATAPGPTAAQAGAWTAALALPLGALLAALALGAEPGLALTLGLAAFGVVFATDSAVHSYLIVAYAAGERVARDVGFYYSSNAAGRLAGTVLSGALFQALGGGEEGLMACLAASVVLAAASALLCVPLRAAERERALRTP